MAVSPQASVDAIRIVVAEDHVIVRKGIVALLGMQDGLKVVGEAGDGHDTIALHERLRPDVTLLDLRMPNLDGWETLSALRALHPNGRVVVLTTCDTDDDLSRALAFGAQDFLLKGASTATLVEAIRTVHAGARYIQAEVAARLLPAADGPSLTTRELEILRRIARGLGNKDIGRELFISESTVKGHVNTLLAKLGVSDRTKALVEAVRRRILRVD